MGVTVTIILGPPGTGKTTRLLHLVERVMGAGVKPYEVAFIAFTKRAASEAIERATAKFNLHEDELPYFRTIHSLCYRQLGLRQSMVLQREHFAELGEHLGLVLTGSAVDIDEGEMKTEGDDRLVFLENLARVRGIPLRTLWEELDEDIDWWSLDHLARSLTEFKQKHSLIDFTDMLEQFIVRAPVPHFKVLFVDEAQDLSRLQWRVVERLISHAEQTFIAGDDDQAIFKWAGADVDYFISREGRAEVLDYSYRCPSAVHNLALSVLSHIKSRREKVWKPRAEGGDVAWQQDLDGIDADQGEWLMLCRHGYQLTELEKLCRLNGYPYKSRRYNFITSGLIPAILTWEKLRKGEKVTKAAVRQTLSYGRILNPKILDTVADTQELGMKDLLDLGAATTEIWHEAFNKVSVNEREYLISCLRRGESLTKEPRVRISTIHGAKGAQADNVVLVTDISNRAYQGMLKSEADERRVLYVALTRAKQALHLIMPQTNRSLPL